MMLGIALSAQNKNNADNGKNKDKDKVQEKDSSQGVSDTKISPGASGVKRSIGYKFDENTEATNPGKGIFRYNSEKLPEISWIYVDNIDISGEDQTKWYSTWDDTTGAMGRGRISLAALEGKNIDVFDITGLFVLENSYWKIPVKYVSGSLPFTSATYYCIFERIENKKQDNDKVEKPENQPSIAEEKKPDQPAVVVEEKKPDQPVVVVEEKKPDQPLVVAEEKKPDQPVVVVEEKKPDQAVVVAEEKKPDQPLVVVEEKKPEKPSEIQKEVKPEEPVVIILETKQDKPVEVQQEVKPVQPAITAQKDRQFKQEQKPAKLPQQTKPAKPAQPVEQVQTTQQTQTTQQKQSTAQTQTLPAVQTKPANQQTTQQKPAQTINNNQVTPTNNTAQPTQQQIFRQQPEQPQQQVPASQPANESRQVSAYKALPSVPNIFSGSSGSNSSMGFAHGKWYHGIIEVGYSAGLGEYGLSNFRFNFINGIYICPTTSIGLGIGYRRYFDKASDHPDRNLLSGVSQIPVFLDLRTTFTTRKVTPYLAFGIGGAASTASGVSRTEGLFITPSGGIWFNLSDRIAVFAGIAGEMQRIEYELVSDNSHFYKNSTSVSLNVGISF